MSAFIRPTGKMLQLSSLLLSAIFLFVLAGCASSVQSDSESEKDYAFAPHDYVVSMSAETIDGIDVREYLPRVRSVAEYEYLDGSQPYHISESFEQTSEGVSYEGALSGVPYRGTLYYDSSCDSLADRRETMHTDEVYLIPIGKSYTSNGVTLQPVDRLFTVKTPYGSLEDCVCVLETEEGQPAQARYYAKGIGIVFTACEDEQSTYFKPLMVLGDFADAPKANQQSKGESKESGGFSDFEHTNYFKGGGSYQCPETGSSVELMPDEDEETGAASLRLSFDDGAVTTYRYAGYSIDPSDESSVSVIYENSEGSQLIVNVNTSSWFTIESDPEHNGFYELAAAERAG